MTASSDKNSPRTKVENMRLLLLFSVILSLVVVISSWMIHVSSGRSRIFLPFISETDTDFLEGTIFSIGLTIVGLTYPILGLHLYNSKKLEFTKINFNENHVMLNKIALGLSFFNAISIIMVSNLPWFKYPIPHAIFANFVFAGGLAWAIFYHKLDSDIDAMRGEKRHYSGLRSNLFIIWFVGIGLMSVGFITGLTQNPNLLQTLDFDSVRTEMLVAAIGEWLMFLASAFVFGTFYEDLLELE